MKRCVLAILGLSVCGVAGAQPPPVAGQTAQRPVMHMPDGGTRETVISIAVPLLTGSPFSAVVETEWMKLLPDGSTATTRNRRTIARDSSGRVFEERMFLRPDGDVEQRLRAVQYRDPNRHEFTDCLVEQRVCYVSRMMGRALTAMPAMVRRAVNPNVKEEALGEKQEGGLNLVGTREITTLPAGRFGNTKPEPIVKEFWYSPVLGVNLVTKRFDPRTGSQNFLVTNVSQNEPDPKRFELPEGYRVVRTEGIGAEMP